MSPEELQVQLDLLETQQLGLERQGVLIERMIRDKCEGKHDHAHLFPFGTHSLYNCKYVYVIYSPQTAEINNWS